MTHRVHTEWVPLLDPPEPEIERSPLSEAGLNRRAETERLLALHHLNRARACLALLANDLRADLGRRAMPA